MEREPWKRRRKRNRTRRAVQKSKKRNSLETDESDFFVFFFTTLPLSLSLPNSLFVSVSTFGITPPAVTCAPLEPCEGAAPNRYSNADRIRWIWSKEKKWTWSTKTRTRKRKSAYDVSLDKGIGTLHRRDLRIANRATIDTESIFARERKYDFSKNVWDIVFPFLF